MKFKLLTIRSFFAILLFLICAVKGYSSNNLSSVTHNKKVHHSGVYGDGNLHIPKKINPPATSIIPVGPLNFCAGDSVILSIINPSNNSTYNWLLNGTNIVGATQDTLHVKASGTYNCVVSYNGNNYTLNNVVVTVYAKPIASFTVNFPLQCVNNNSFIFNNTSSIMSGSITYVWHFGDGTTAFTTNTTHFYTTAGTYMVKLIATSNNGCVDSSSLLITVSPKPMVGFTSNGNIQCLNRNIFVFTNTSIINSGTITHQWIFGDGSSTNTINATHVYTNSGSYVVKLITTSNNGCKDSTSQTITVNANPAVSFIINQPSQCLTENNFTFSNTSTINNGTMSYMWHFGDGFTTTSINASHVYGTSGTYIVKLIATSNNNCIDSFLQTINVRAKPNVSFNINSVAQCLNGNNFLFINTSTITNGSMSYQWYFGDGGTGNSTNATYSYSTSGTFTVKLVATSNYGCQDSATALVTINPKPIVIFSINNNIQCKNANSFIFTNTSSISNGTMSYLWDFGDGITASTISATHSYIAAGTYTIKLVALSNNNCTDSTTRQVTVNPSPINNFTVNQMVQCFNGNNFIFNNTTSISSGTMQFNWTFGDGIGSATQTNPLYNYLASGTYTVTLVATSNLNCSSTSLQQMIVRPSPVGTIATPVSSTICDGSFITLSTSGGDTYQWFLDGQLILGATANTFIATLPGVYKVLLQNNYGCTAYASNSITLNKVIQPVINFSYNKYCAGIVTNFTNFSDLSQSGTVNYEWGFGDGGTSALQNPTYTYVLPGSYTVKLTITPLACINLRQFATKNIVVQASPSNMRYTSLNAISNRTLQLQAREFSGASYSWIPSVGINNPFINNPVFNYSEQQQYLININTTAGCQLTDSLLIKMFSKKEIFVPDVFSPNGDNNNDKLTPLLVGVSLRNFKIYNRWGQLVFQSNKAGDGWDGMYQGTKQPMEIYSWVAEGRDVDGNIINRNGSSLLLR